MYKKYLQKIWLTKEIKTISGNSVSYKYKLDKKLTEITGKKNAINWMEKYYLSKKLKPTRTKGIKLILELVDSPSNHFFLVMPISNKRNTLKLVYVNIDNYLMQ